MSKINFSQDQYATFINILDLLKENCGDVTITEGKILQENNPKTILYDIDLTSILGKETIYIDGLKSKYDLLNIFKNQNCKVILDTENDKKYIYTDGISKIEFPIPLPSNMNPKPLQKNSTRATTLTTLSETKIFEFELNRMILDRINTSLRSLNSNDVVVTLKNDEATMSVFFEGSNTAIVNKFLTISDINNCGYEGVIRFPKSPFLLGSEKEKIYLYVNKKEETKMTMKFEAKINDIDIYIWSTMPFKNLKKEK